MQPDDNNRLRYAATTKPEEAGPKDVATMRLFGKQTRQTKSAFQLMTTNSNKNVFKLGGGNKLSRLDLELVKCVRKIQ